ncbi:MAG: diguanylate cyclase [Sedimenticola sp.]
MGDANNPNDIQELKEQLRELERKNKLLRQSVAQGDRIQKMWRDSVDELKKTKKALKQSEERFELAMEGSRDGVWDWDLETKRAYYSPRSKAMLGYSEDEIGDEIDETLNRVHPEDAHKFRRTADAYLARVVDRFEVIVRMRTKSGNYRWVLTRGKALWNRAGKPIRFVGTTVDLTERMEIEQQLKLGAQVMEFTSEGVIVTNKDAKIEAVNPAFTELTGYTQDEVLGRNPSLLASGRHPPEFFEAMWKTLKEEGDWSGEIWNRRKDGQLYAEAVKISAIYNQYDEVTHYVGILSDVTEQRKRVEHLQHMAFHDALTGLPNRLVFNDRLGQAIRHAKRTDEKIAVLFFDLDKFKAVNDTFGHKVGDLLLKGVTERVQSCLREEDTIARVGGDEFCAVLRGDGQVPHFAEAAHRIIDRLNKPFDLEGNICTIGCSIGISLYPSDSTDQVKLVKYADEALYAAKEGGRNRYVFHSQNH